MQRKVHVKKGDQVKVISGESKGQEGKVLMVDRIKFRAIVEGLNMVSKHTKPNAANPDGGIIKKEAPIHLSNLMVVDGEGNPTRVGRRKDDDGKMVRYSKRSEEKIVIK